MCDCCISKVNLLSLLSARSGSSDPFSPRDAVSRTNYKLLFQTRGSLQPLRSSPRNTISIVHKFVKWNYSSYSRSEFFLILYFPHLLRSPGISIMKIFLVFSSSKKNILSCVKDDVVLPTAVSQQIDGASSAPVPALDILWSLSRAVDLSCKL